ncbi:snRNA-activating protein complex subunit 1-like [Cylas formicarius]|uniref:snRNA-activating protein complex subunit 1-like n=1 Tax=Cylas formicarius TaxID=197179 RepID=UPI0029585753|nr:snRNA-activating protein complex subunit 1-like [Cylas formicarius]
MSEKEKQSSNSCPPTKPRKSSVLKIYEKSVLTAFKFDCENFLEYFESLKSFHYTDFANLWQVRQFTYIYADQNYVTELTTLCEVAFSTVKKYIVFRDNPYIKMGAFYLLYGLYYKQPIKGLVKIRLTLSEFKSIKELMYMAKSQNHFEPLYIFAKMKCDKAFLYVAHYKPLKPSNNSKHSNTTFDDTFQGKGTESSLAKFKDLIQDGLVKDLGTVCTKYDAAFRKYAEICPSLSLFPSSVIEEFDRAYDNIFGSNLKNNSTDTSVANKRRSIRQKAVTNQNAVYRGSRKVLTAMDLSEGESNSD